ncbi:FAD-binding oxidoreductase [Kribbella sp. NPDC051718]|uniref:FAD-binding oxidoreductase n=1 Tax=Kribbella sp. NPDC051718 TaxID=3155168 RepID=UPI00343CBA1E
MKPWDGRLWRVGDPGFEKASVAGLFNQRVPSRRPLAVLRAGSVADVVAGLGLAAQEGWQVAVRAGGHSWTAWSLRERTLLIDVSNLRDLAYDPATGIATVGAGARGGHDLDPFLARHDRFFPVGHAPSVGVAGFLLQGGLGWNTRGWGWAVEHVESLDVVAASGELVHCSEEENADLFWMARGSGPGFTGVVTSFRLRTRPRFRHLTHATWAYPVDTAPEILSWYAECRHAVPDEVELALVGCTVPGLGQVIVVDALSFDGGADSLGALETCPVRGRALSRETTSGVSFADLLAAQDRANPEGHRYHVDNAFLTGPADDWCRALVPTFGSLPTPQTFTVLGDLGPAARRARPEMAFSVDTDLYFAAYAITDTPSGDTRCQDWLARTMADLAPSSAGCYLGDTDLATRSARVMSDAAWIRYQLVRDDRDPERRFPGFLGEPSQAVNAAAAIRHPAPKKAVQECR